MCLQNERVVSLDMQYIFKMTKEEKRQAGQQSSSPESAAASNSEGDTLLIPSVNGAVTTADETAAEAGEVFGTEALSTETLTEPAPRDGPHDAAIMDWHWHSSKWEARASRTTLNNQGGYDGSEDHPGYGTEAGPDFRCATISPVHLTTLRNRICAP